MDVFGCGFLCLFFFFLLLNTRGELRVSQLAGERLAVCDGSTRVPRHLPAVWVSSELRAWKIKAAQDFQAFST